MIGINKNRYNKTRKNKNIKEGPCIFPFKYKWKTHRQCFSQEDGDICATEVNPKTQTLIKYGYCKESNSLNNNSSKNSSKTSSKNSSKKNSKSKKKTIKKKSKEKIVKDDKQKMESKEKETIEKKESMNRIIINALGELNKLMMQKGEVFRARAYQKAQQEIFKYKKEITSVNDIKELPNIGATIFEKLQELEQTGKIETIERQKQIILEQEKLPENILSKIYGVGPKRSKELVDKGITSIEELKKPENIKLLNDKQKIGLQYYYDILERNPRSEIEEFKTVLEKIFNRVSKNVQGISSFEIVGSYRRNAQTSGDIDLIITNSENNSEIFKLFIDELVKEEIIIELLSRGKVKSLTIGRLPTGTSTENRVARRIDLLYSPPKEYSFAILYFTGSQEFNTVMRQHALDMGYTLNEHGISTKQDGIKGDLVTTTEFKTEKDIFDFFNLEYKTPIERKDGYAVTIKEEKTEAKQPEAKQPEAKQPEAKQETKSKSHNKTQKRTLETKPENIMKRQLEEFLNNGISVLDTMSEKELITMLKHTEQEYYCNTNPVMSDDEYDILREYIIIKYPDNKDADTGHEKCEITKNRVTLPYHMWSMDKIKPDSKELDKYKKRYKGPYVLSCKLDGISGLYSTENDKPQLYTRGNGQIGTDISHLIEYLVLPKTKNVVLRGEIIMKKKTFTDKYSKNFKNARNLVAGLVNNKSITPERISMFKDLNFVAYEVIKPEQLKPSVQMDYLSSLKDTIAVQNKTIDNTNLDNNILSELLVKWRSEYIYEIDGVICANDAVYRRVDKNPEHAFAFKMVLTEQTAEARVVDVIWTPSKDGYLKPRVQIEPVTLGGVTITYLTGKNARFIKNRKIGLGAVIRVVRSGDVIPEIEDKDDVVIKPANIALFPEEEYIWNETNVDIMLVDKSKNRTVIVKTIANFFKQLEVENIGEGIVKKLVDAGYDTIAKILGMTREDFLKIDGFKNTMATKLSTNIKTKIDEKTVGEIAAASNLFGRGMGKQRIETVIENYPEVLTSKETPNTKIEHVKKIPGMAQKTAIQFVEAIPRFIEFLDTANMREKLTSPNKSEISSSKSNTSKEEHELKGKKIVMTGFRDKELETQLKKIGAVVKNNVTKDTYVVLVKDLEEDTGKANDAREANIPLMLPEEFRIVHDLIK